MCLFFDELYVKLSSLLLKEYIRKRPTRYLSIQIQYSVHKRLNNVHKRLTEARFRFVTMTSTNCIKVQNGCSGQKYHTYLYNLTILKSAPPLGRPSALVHILTTDQKCHAIAIKCTC